MNESLENMLSHLPSGEKLARDFSVTEADTLGIGYSGDKHEGQEIYKLLSREGFMFSYLRNGNLLKFWCKQKLHN